jgi:hypothetical protein
MVERMIAGKDQDEMPCFIFREARHIESAA